MAPKYSVVTIVGFRVLMKSGMQADACFKHAVKEANAGRDVTPYVDLKFAPYDEPSSRRDYDYNYLPVKACSFCEAPLAKTIINVDSEKK